MIHFSVVRASVTAQLSWTLICSAALSIISKVIFSNTIFNVSNGSIFFPTINISGVKTSPQQFFSLFPHHYPDQKIMPIIYGEVVVYATRIRNFATVPTSTRHWCRICVGCSYFKSDISSVADLVSQGERKTNLPWWKIEAQSKNQIGDTLISNSQKIMLDLVLLFFFLLLS